MRILVATDGTPGSSGAIRLATTLAALPGTSIRLLHVLEPLEVHGPPNAQLLAPPDPYFAEQRRASALARLEAGLAEFGPIAQAWPVEVEIGPVPITIVRAAEADEAALIVLGLGRHDRAARWFGTETAVRVAQLSHVPVLAVPESSDGSLPRRVVAAVDFSRFSRAAVTTAIRVSEAGAEVHVAHVLRAPPADVEELAPDWTGRLREQRGTQLEQWTKEWVEGAGARPQSHLIEGDPAEQVLDLADRVGADLIATGSHGMGFLGRLLLGSVSTRILRGATCAVLVAPPAERAGHGFGATAEVSRTPPRGEGRKEEGTGS